MPRYVVERTFTDGLHIPIDAGGAQLCLAVVADTVLVRPDPEPVSALGGSDR